MKRHSCVRSVRFDVDSAALSIVLWPLALLETERKAFVYLRCSLAAKVNRTLAGTHWQYSQSDGYDGTSAYGALNVDAKFSPIA